MIEPILFIEQGWKWITPPAGALQVIEKAGRTCYKSEAQITPGSAKKFVASLIKRGHESVIEHAVASVLFITNRGVTHELVRHRLASFSQESTRYVNYKSRGLQFILPVWWSQATDTHRRIFTEACRSAAKSYHDLLADGWRPEQAREVLPNALKTEIVVTANLREWRHIFRQRCAPPAHPQIRQLMSSLLAGFTEIVPDLFTDIKF